MSTHLETAQQLPLTSDCEVLVAGAGPAGVAAAITAARSGASVRLFEVHGALGGVWTAGLLTYVLDAGNKTGFFPELLRRLEQATGRPVRKDQGIHSHLPWVDGSFYYDTEAMKLVLEEMCADAGVHVQLGTRVVAAARDASNRLSVVITESKSGREAWSAQVFIDATGDGDLSAQAGCAFDYGRPGTSETQPLTLMAVLTGIDAEHPDVRPCIHGIPGNTSPHQNLLKCIHRGGFTPSYHSPALFPASRNLFGLMANHEYQSNSLNAAALTAATLRARAEVNRVVSALRNAGGGWTSIQLAATGAQIGVRESRRIYGHYRVTAEDLIHGAHHEDAICHVTFPVDIHSTDPAQGKSFGSEGVQARPYDIPMRALIAAGIDGLLLAGRCISGDFFAHSSYRVTGNAVAIGEGAGALAACSARSGRLPQDVPFADVRACLDKIRKFAL